jgi:hypothetical protein
VSFPGGHWLAGFVNMGDVQQPLFLTQSAG